MAEEVWSWGPALEVSHLDYVAKLRHTGEPDCTHLEILIRYGEHTYTAIIDTEPEYEQLFGNGWVLGLSRDRPGKEAESLLDGGVEAFSSLDEAITSALLTIIACATQPPGTWEAARRRNEGHGASPTSQ